MSLKTSPEDLSLMLPDEKVYERIYAKNTPDELLDKLVPTILYNSNLLMLSLYGHRLFYCSQTIENTMNLSAEPKLPPQTVFSTKDDRYTIKKMLGPRTYLVTSLKVTGERILKLEYAERPIKVPRIQTSLSVFQKIKEVKQLFPKTEFFQTLIAFHVNGVFKEQFEYFITDYYDCNLQDMLCKTLDNRPIMKTTAIHLATETLKGIQGLHLLRFMHRDIQPSNFYVGRGANCRSIYLGGLNSCYYWGDKNMNEVNSILCKVRSINARFQCRRYHVVEPMNPIDDLESWVYMVIFFLLPTALPWKNVMNERIGYELKCLLINGSCTFVPEVEHFVRSYLNYFNLRSIKTIQEVDFGFFCSVLELYAKETGYNVNDPLDWEYEPMTKKVVKAERPTIKIGLYQPMTDVKNLCEISKSLGVKAKQNKKATNSVKSKTPISKFVAKHSMEVKPLAAILKPVKNSEKIINECPGKPSPISGKSITKLKTATKSQNKIQDTQEMTIEDESNVTSMKSVSVAVSKSKLMKISSSVIKKKKDIVKEEAIKEIFKEEDGEKESNFNEANMN